MEKMYIYSEEFYDKSEDTSKKAAEIIMPYILSKIKPKSIVDFGCGEGIWLQVIKQLQDQIEILGIDGEYINRKELKIPEKCFVPANLERKISLSKKYDLAMTLEVAEHLDERASDIFIDNITRASDNVLFSAAIPGQGGVNHVNEQWQEYWIKKFEARGSSVDTSLRNLLWNEQQIVPWRRQNILFFTKRCLVPIMPEKSIYNVVHPDMYSSIIKKLELLEQRQEKKSSYIGIKEIYIQIEKVIKELIDKGHKNFVIYPYGQNGYLCKEILNYKYHINEIAIVDNILCKTNTDVLSAEQLKNIQYDFCIVENCSNITVHKEVISEIKEYVKQENIFTVFPNKM